jgi:hypothetical protein
VRGRARARERERAPEYELPCVEEHAGRKSNECARTGYTLRGWDRYPEPGIQGYRGEGLEGMSGGIRGRRT